MFRVLVPETSRQESLTETKSVVDAVALCKTAGRRQKTLQRRLFVTLSEVKIAFIFARKEIM